MKLSIISTGGTIDKMYSSDKGTKYLSIGKPAIDRILDRIPDNIDYNIEEACRVDSLDMDNSDRANISELIEESDRENIIVTHGTDTIKETAQYIENRHHKKSVVLVGSSKPEVFRDSDADLNVGAALSAIDMIDKGVKVVMHGRVHDPMTVEKTEDGHFRSADPSAE